MNVRTYYWEDNIVGPLRYFIQTYIRRGPKVFKKGNAGDIYARYLIKHLYDAGVSNIRDEGRRQLFIGSIAHLVKDHDLVCGIGTKGEPFRSAAASTARIWGVRGPITLDAFKQAGFDVSDVRFQLDPGLMIKFTINPDAFTAQKKHISFIPHYREKKMYQKRLPKGVTLIDIDDCPHRVGAKILQSKLVYSSSLHGIIFSHSLGVPCVFVRPQSKEPLIKFEDYFLSVGLTPPKPIDTIDALDFKKDSDTPADVRIERQAFEFPTKDFLIQNGYMN